MDNRNLFQFVPSEDGNMILFIYAREGMPDSPLLRLVPNENRAEFYRNGEDAFDLNTLDSDILSYLKKQKKLLVCEILPAENKNEVEISSSYLIEITE